MTLTDLSVGIRDRQIIGRRVRKITGDYHLSGEVRGVITTSTGAVRVVVEHTPLAPGLLHIYSLSQLDRAAPAGE